MSVGSLRLSLVLRYSPHICRIKFCPTFVSMRHKCKQGLYHECIGYLLMDNNCLQRFSGWWNKTCLADHMPNDALPVRHLIFPEGREFFTMPVIGFKIVDRPGPASGRKLLKNLEPWLSLPNSKKYIIKKYIWLVEPQK